MLLAFGYGIAFVISCFGFTPLFIPKVRAILSFPHYSYPGPLFHVYAVIFFIAVPFGFIQLVKKINRSMGNERKQILGFTLVTGIGFLGGSLTFLPIYGITLPLYGIFLLPIYPFGMAYFMIKEKLFDVEEFAKAAQRDKLAAIGTLTTSINHEVRNPLYVIQGLAQSYLEKGKLDDEKTREFFEKIEVQSKRATEIVHKLTSFAKQETEKEIELKKVGIQKVLDNIQPLIQYELSKHKTNLTLDIPKDLTLTADIHFMEEIFFNLIVNASQAIKHTGRPGKISITARDSGVGVRVTVSDDGPGIPEDKISQVFTPFYTTKEEGTGLGLYITKQLVEKNKGRIFVESKIDEGTTFRLEFQK